MSEPAIRQLLRSLRAGTLTLLVVSCLSLAVAFRYDEPLIGAFALGASATCLAGAVLLLSYGVFVRSVDESGETALAAGPDAAGAVAGLASRLSGRLAVDLALDRESGGRLRGSLRIRNFSNTAMRSIGVEGLAPAGSRVAIVSGLEPGEPTPVTVTFDDETGRCAVDLEGGGGCRREIVVLLPDGARPGDRLQLAVSIEPLHGEPVVRKVLRQRVPR